MGCMNQPEIDEIFAQIVFKFWKPFSGSKGTSFGDQHQTRILSFDAFQRIALFDD